MNILWIPNFLPYPADNGGKVVIANRMEQVAKKHSVFLVAESEAPSEDARRVLDCVCADFELVKPIPRGGAYQIKWLARASLNVGRYFNPGMTEAIGRMLQKHRIDLINVDLPMPYVNLYPVCDRIRGIPVVINQQNIEFDNVRSKVRAGGVSGPMKLYAAVESAQLLRWETRLYRSGAVCAFSFVSDMDRKLFEKQFEARPRELFLAPIGTKLPADQPKSHNVGERAIVFPAAFHYPPNIHGALWFAQWVMPEVRKAVSGAKLYLVGSNPVEEIKRLASEDVIVTGTVPSMEPYLRKADLFIVPIFYGGGVKTKLLEISGYRTPVVSSSQGCAGTLYQPGEDLLVADEPLPFAEACIDALLKPQRYAAMVERMLQKTKENYLWASLGEKYCAFLERHGKRMN